MPARDPRRPARLRLSPVGARLDRRRQRSSSSVASATCEARRGRAAPQSTIRPGAQDGEGNANLISSTARILVPAVGRLVRASSIRELMIKNPVMFVVEVVAALTTVLFIRDLVTGGAEPRLHVPDHPLAVVHACCSRTSPRRSPKAAARRRPKSLRRTRTETQAKLLGGDGRTELQDRCRAPS